MRSREAGSYGKDVRGLNRLHQFDKVEIVRIERPEDSYAALEEMKDHVQGLLDKLGLPWHILRLCGGDMSFTSAITFDFEVYSAAQGRWLEVSSVSNFETYQANRLKCRYRGADKKTRLCHTLNGSALAQAAHVLAVAAGLAAETGRVGAVLDGQVGVGENHVAVKVRHGHFRRGDEVEVVGCDDVHLRFLKARRHRGAHPRNPARGAQRALRHGACGSDRRRQHRRQGRRRHA